MSIDKSLRSRGSLARHRNVLSRAERIMKLQDEGRWEDQASPFGLIKVAHRKPKVGGKSKAKAEAATDETAAEGETPANEPAAEAGEKKK